MKPDYKSVEKIGGMTIYNADQIVAALKQAGFADVKVDQNSRGWICVTALK